MAAEPRNPNQLRRLRRQLTAYRRVLPSLELKRRQLAAQFVLERQQLQDERQALEAGLRAAIMALPMLAGDSPSLADLVRIEPTASTPEYRAGVRLPVHAGLATQVAAYARCASPPWIDGLVEHLVRVADLDLALRVREQRMELVERALRKATQRVNLLEKLLVPRALKTARGIELALADSKRSEVVRAKIAKTRLRA